jgi:hypothetical protein
MTIVRTKRRLGLGRQRLRGLGQDVADPYAAYSDPNFSAYGSAAPIFSDASGGTTDVNPLSPTFGQTIAGTSSVPGSISAQDAALLSTAITTAGKVGTQAIIGSPTLTYNPATGQYTATGGATIPSSLSISSAISSYLPIILLGGGLLLLVSAMGKR